MGYSVRVATSAHDSVLSSVGYIAEVCFAPHAAARLLREYESTLVALRDNPTFCPVSLAASQQLGRRIFRKSIPRYFLYFYVDEGADGVVVFSFLHRKQDALAHLPHDYGEA